MKRLEIIERKIDDMSGNGLDEEQKETKFLYKGVNINRISAASPYAYGLQLMDMLFDKEELRTSLLFESKKSEKLCLDKERVAKLFELIEDKFCEVQE